MNVSAGRRSGLLPGCSGGVLLGRRSVDRRCGCRILRGGRGFMRLRERGAALLLAMVIVVLVVDLVIWMVRRGYQPPEGGEA